MYTAKAPIVRHERCDLSSVRGRRLARTGTLEVLSRAPKKCIKATSARREEEQRKQQAPNRLTCTDAHLYVRSCGGISAHTHSDTGAQPTSCSLYQPWRYTAALSSLTASTEAQKASPTSRREKAGWPGSACGVSLPRLPTQLERLHDAGFETFIMIHIPLRHM